MLKEKKNRIAAIILVILGLAIGAIGLVGMLAPPLITGIGFFVISWVLVD